MIRRINRPYLVLVTLLLCGSVLAVTAVADSEDASEAPVPASATSAPWPTAAPEGDSLTVVAGGFALRVPAAPETIAYTGNHLFIDYGPNGRIGVTTDTPSTLAGQYPYLSEGALTIPDWLSLVFLPERHEPPAGTEADLLASISATAQTLLGGGQVFVYRRRGLTGYRILNNPSLPYPDTTSVVADSSPGVLLRVTFGERMDRRSRDRVTASIEHR